ncbi:MAG: hypothetical protein ACYSW4_05300 [Planctomycetota bacterium]|jgi:hypothetical protein
MGRSVALVIGTALLVLAGFLFREAWRVNRWFDDLQKEEILNSKADLSKQEGYVIPFSLEQRAPLGVWIDVEVPKTVPSCEEARGLLKQINGRISVVDSNDQIVWKKEFSDEYIRCSETGSGAYSLFLARTVPMPEGSYMLNLDVNEPAPALAEATHVVRGRYTVCGCMARGALVAGLAGCVIGGIGITIIAAVVVITLKRRKKTSTKQSADRTD